MEALQTRVAALAEARREAEAAAAEAAREVARAQEEARLRLADERSARDEASRALAACANQSKKIFVRIEVICVFTQSVNGPRLHLKAIPVKQYGITPRRPSL